MRALNHIEIEIAVFKMPSDSRPHFTIVANQAQKGSVLQVAVHKTVVPGAEFSCVHVTGTGRDRCE